MPSIRPANRSKEVTMPMRKGCVCDSEQYGESNSMLVEVMHLDAEDNSSTIDWQSCRLEDLSTKQLYAVIAARVAVFVVEQTCPYQELDGLDFQAAHLIAWDRASSEVAAYLRVLEPGVRFTEPSIG